MCTFVVLAYFYWDRGGFCFVLFVLDWAGFLQFGCAKGGVSLTNVAQRNKNMKTDCSHIQIPHLF